MSWRWTRRAPACDSTSVQSKAESDEEVVIKLERTMNSSHHYPGLARIFNNHQQQSATPQLLAMPDKVLHNILRFTLIEKNPICVAADHPEDCNENGRGILSVCHAIRKVARPLFYKENLFEVQVFSFDIKAVLPWLEMSAKVLLESKNNAATQENQQKSDDIKLQDREDALTIDTDDNPVETMTDMQLLSRANAQHSKPSKKVLEVFGASYGHFIKPSNSELDHSDTDIKPLSSKQIEMLEYFMSKLHRNFEQEQGSVGGFFIVPKFEPHWDNLVEWLHSFHHGQVPRYTFDENSPEFCHAVAGLFDLVELEKEEGRTWDLFERRLPVLRTILAKNDARWMHDGPVLR